VSDTEGDEPRGQRTPGWYPDPREPGRHRHWDGTRWSELSATSPLVTDEGPAPATPEVHSRRPLVALVAAFGVVLLLAVGAWVALGGDDSDRDDTAASRSSTTAVAEPAPDPSTSPPPSTATTDPDVATTTTSGNSSATPGDDAAPCTVEDAELLGLLRDHPPLASLADGLTVDQVRCAGSWSSAVVAAADTDQSLAVFRRGADGWTLVLVGSAEPCSGLGIPTEAEGPLGCGDW
jgi:hypothetical protein